MLGVNSSWPRGPPLSYAFAPKSTPRSVIPAIISGVDFLCTAYKVKEAAATEPEAYKLDSIGRVEKLNAVSDTWISGVVTLLHITGLN